MIRWYLIFFVAVLLLALSCVGVSGFSSRDMVAIHFTAENDQPLEIAINEPEMKASPGDTKRVIYRVKNPGTEPRNVIATLEYEPPSAEFQVRLFQTDCGKWTLINPGETVEFETVFSILPAGPFGSDQITLRHVFAKP